MRRSVLALVVLALGAYLIACESSDDSAAQSTRTPSPSLPTLIIGLIPEHDIFKQLRRYEPLAGYLSRKLEVDLQLKPLPRYGNIVASFQEGQMDGAFFGSFTYVLAHAKLGVEVLARPEWADGTASYHGLLLTRTDSGIRNAEDMRGKVFVFVDKATTAGYILPLAYFREHGIDDYRSYFKETYFAGTHAGAATDVLEGKADVGAMKNTVYDRMARQNPRIRDELTILVRSPDVPANGLAVRKDLDPELQHKLQETLLTMHQDPDGAAILEEFGAPRFIPTTTADYRPVTTYAQIIGLDLATYDYVND